MAEACVACGGGGTLAKEPCVVCGGDGSIADDPRADHWTRDLVLARFREWVAEHGGPPTHSDWNPARWNRAARASRARLRRQLERAARYEAGRWPSSWTVRSLFGSWGAMFLAAGYERRPVGRPREGEPDVAQPVDRELAARAARDVRYAADRPGPDELAARVRRVARARAQGDQAALRASLYQLAATAVAWIDLLDNDRQENP